MDTEASRADRLGPARGWGSEGSRPTAARWGISHGSGSAVALAVLAFLYGYLDNHPHPTLSLVGAILLSFAGAGVILLLIPEKSRQLPGLAAPSQAGSLTMLLVGLLSIQAALIHLAVIEQHLIEYWLYGAFFVAVGGAQLITGLLVIKSPTRPLLWAIGAGNLLVSATWVITRTVGSLVGPEATTPAMVGFGDVAVSVFQVLIAAGCIVLLRSSWTQREISGPAAAKSWVPLLVIISTTTALAMFSAVAGPPFVSHVG